MERSQKSRDGSQGTLHSRDWAAFHAVYWNEQKRNRGVSRYHEMLQESLVWQLYYKPVSLQTWICDSCRIWHNLPCICIIMQCPYREQLTDAMTFCRNYLHEKWSVFSRERLLMSWDSAETPRNLWYSTMSLKERRLQIPSYPVGKCLLYSAMSLHTDSCGF